jgi:hypothetical protein
MAQDDEHPSPSVVLPSSQLAPSFVWPLPHASSMKSA